MTLHTRGQGNGELAGKKSRDSEEFGNHRHKARSLHLRRSLAPNEARSLTLRAGMQTSLDWAQLRLAGQPGSHCEAVLAELARHLPSGGLGSRPQTNAILTSHCKSNRGCSGRAAGHQVPLAVRVHCRSQVLASPLAVRVGWHVGLACRHPALEKSGAVAAWQEERARPQREKYLFFSGVPPSPTIGKP